MFPILIRLLFIIIRCGMTDVSVFLIPNQKYESNKHLNPNIIFENLEPTVWTRSKLDYGRLNKIYKRITYNLSQNTVRKGRIMIYAKKPHSDNNKP